MAMYIKGMLPEAKEAPKYNIMPVTEERNVAELKRQETPVGRSMMVLYVINKSLSGSESLRPFHVISRAVRGLQACEWIRSTNVKAKCHCSASPSQRANGGYLSLSRGVNHILSLSPINYAADPCAWVEGSRGVCDNHIALARTVAYDGGLSRFSSSSSAEMCSHGSSSSASSGIWSSRAMTTGMSDTTSKSPAGWSWRHISLPARDYSSMKIWEGERTLALPRLGGLHELLDVHLARLGCRHHPHRYRRVPAGEHRTFDDVGDDFLDWARRKREHRDVLVISSDQPWLCVALPRVLSGSFAAVNCRDGDECSGPFPLSLSAFLALLGALAVAVVRALRLEDDALGLEEGSHGLGGVRGCGGGVGGGLGWGGVDVERKGGGARGAAGAESGGSREHGHCGAAGD